MLPNTGNIRPLPAEVAAQIKSSVAITSLSFAVLGLVENALDGGAVNISVSVDFGQGSCSVEDNGHGIEPADFAAEGGLGKLYHTSRCGDIAKRYGEHGTFLASLAALSILTITSHHQAHRSTSTLILHHSRPIARMIPAPAHHQLSFRTHGTRVRVQDLFGTMPVRVKQRPSAEDGRKIRDKEWESLRRSVTGTLLAWGNPVSLTVHGPDRNQRLRFSFPTSFSIPPETPLEHHVLHKDFDLVLIRNILHQGAGIDLSDMKTWVKTSARISLLTIRGLISLKPAPSKGTQFICLGYQNLAAGSECGILYDEVNRLFALSNFGCREDLMNMDGADISRIESRRSECHSFTKEGLKGGGKGVDRWPMFFVQIEVHFGSPWHQRSNTLSAKQSSLLSSIINVLQAMITGFLTEHHFRPPKRYLRTFNALSSETTSPVSQHIESLPLNDPTAQNIVLKCTNDSSVKWRPRIGNNNTDPCHDLNGQIKLPNFSRKESPLVRDDFGGRSRVKQSLRGSTFTSLVVKPTIELPLHSKRTCGTPRLTAGIEISIAREATVEAEASDEEAVAGFSTAVEIQRQTFSDLSDQSDHTNKAADSVKDKNERDSVITWMNPITRVVASINARTGSMVNDQVCLPPGSIVSELPILAQQSMTTFLTRSKPQRCTFDPLRGPKEGSWAERFLKTWENPIFRITEEAIPQIVFDNTCLESKQTLSRNYNRCQAADPATAIRGAFDSFSAKLTKEALQNAIVLAQVDKKFILIKVAVNDEATRGNSVLVLVDQHAADERIRVELLLSELCTRIQPSATQFTSNLGLTSNIVTIRLPKSLSFPITARDRELFEQYAAHFATWGILYDLKVQAKQLAPPKNKIDSTIIVVTLPEAIAERCRVDSKHLIQLLRTEVWKQKENNMNVSKMPEQSADADDRTWIQHVRSCPQGILDMLNSRSCRSAIMFNDILSLGECKLLVKRLANCTFPFQCAHGRPSMVPLVNLRASVDSESGDTGSGIRGLRKVKGGLGRREVEFREAWSLRNGRG